MDRKDVRIETPLDQMTRNEWGSFTGQDYFFPVCRTLPFRKPGAPTAAEAAAGVEAFGGWAINTSCLTGYDQKAVGKPQIEGRKI